MIVEPAEHPEHGVCAVLPGAGLQGAPPHDDSPDAGQKEREHTTSPLPE